MPRIPADYAWVCGKAGFGLLAVPGHIGHFPCTQVDVEVALGSLGP
jgi:hypothetical protein